MFEIGPNRFTTLSAQAAILSCLILVILIAPGLEAAENCVTSLAERNKAGRYFHDKNQSLHREAFVQASKKKSTIDEPAFLISEWFRVLENKLAKYAQNDRAKQQAYDYYFDKYVIKFEDIPDSYYEFQKKLARNRGHGNLELSDAQKQNLAEILIEDQQSSLKDWLNYLVSADTSHQPIWAKYWAFHAVVKMGKFDPAKGRYSKRSSGQVSPFPELNREAFSLVLDSFVKRFRKEAVDSSDKEFLKLLESENFSKLYAYQMQLIHQEALEITKLHDNVEGEWVKFDKGSDHMPLVNSLKGKNTGWCTAGESTAKKQLSSGDFYVFYSLDAEGFPSIPRLAIRMEGSKIGEVRGVAKAQNMDPFIAKTNTLQNKLKEFGKVGEEYLKKDHDMKQLTEIESSMVAGEALTKEQLVFLYEFEDQIEGFGYSRDPRIEEIISARNIRADLSLALSVPIENVTLESKFDPLGNDDTKRVAEGMSKVHYGKLDLREYVDLSPRIIPQRILGRYYFSRNTFLDRELVFPQQAISMSITDVGEISNFHFGGNIVGLSLSDVDLMTNVSFSESYRAIGLSGVKEISNIRWPEEMDSISFTMPNKNSKLTNTVNGVKRINIHGDFNTEDMVLPDGLRALQMSDVSILHDYSFKEGLAEIHLDGVEVAGRLKFPKTTEYIGFMNLEKFELLDFSRVEGGIIRLRSITSTEGLILPKGAARIILDKKFYRANKNFFDHEHLKIVEVDQGS